MEGRDVVYLVLLESSPCHEKHGHEGTRRGPLGLSSQVHSMGSKGTKERDSSSPPDPPPGVFPRTARGAEDSRGRVGMETEAESPRKGLASFDWRSLPGQWP